MRANFLRPHQLIAAVPDYFESPPGPAAPESTMGSRASPTLALDCVACVCTVGAAAAACTEALCSRLKCGMKGVTSNGILSRSERMLTDLALSIVSSSFQGSILTRPPSGSATITLLSAVAGTGAAAEDDGLAAVAGRLDATAQLSGRESPRCGLIKLGISLTRP